MHGLLRAGFVPPADIRRLQDYLRLRADHVAAAGSCVQLMQKALERMNIKLHDVISSLAGASGMAVIRAIVAGERSPQSLFALCNAQIRHRKEQAVIEALRGTWDDEHVFALGQALQSWDHYQKLIADCDSRIANVLPPHDQTQPPLPKTTAKHGGVNAPDIANLREILAQMCGGQDLTQLSALTHYGVLQLVGEVGTDLGVWPTDKHFTAWLGLAPGSNDSGIHKGRVKRKCNRAGRLFCMVAQSLPRHAEGPFFAKLLEAVGYPNASGGSNAAKRQRLINKIREACIKAGRGTVILFCDEAQRFDENEYEWLRDIHDHLDRMEIKLFTFLVLVGQQNLLSIKTNFQRTGKMQIVARLMV